MRELPDGFGPRALRQPLRRRGRRRVPRRPARRRPRRRGAAARRAPGVARGRRRAAGALRARRRGAAAARRRGRARRRAGRAVDRAGGGAGAGLRVPAPRRRRERRPTCCASSPTRCCSRATASSRRARSPDLGVYVPGRGDVALEEALAGHDPARPTVGLVFYRSHRVTGNTAFVDALAAAIDAAGADALCVWAYSLRAGRRRARAGARAARRARRRAGHDGARLRRLDARPTPRSTATRDWSDVARGRAGRARRAGDPGGLRDEQPRGVGGVADAG